MRRYEVLYIVHPDLTDEETKAVSDRYSELVTAQQGTIIKVEDWGRRRLAYEIRKQDKGTYILIDFYGPGSMIKEIERNFRIDDKVLKYLTVKTRDPFDPSMLEKEQEEQTRAETLISPEEAEEAPEKPAEEPAAEPAAEKEPEEGE
jgi:small subunit ribosomal protein S6